MYFRLERDDDGFPPTEWESLWVEDAGSGRFQIKNIPFYVKNISSEDIVEGIEQGNMLRYSHLLEPSGNSVFRIYVLDESKVQSARERFRELNIESELSDVPNLFAIEIPRKVPIEPVLNLLMEGKEREEWDFQEGALRHNIDQ